ncbi:MAG: hydrogenase maturation protease [Sedimenticola sp.]
MSNNPLLIIGYGNPSRGDDALGPEFIRRIERLENLSGFDALTDFQLQIEHALDLEERALVLFVDACESVGAPFEFTQLAPQQDESYSSHAMSPAAVLAVYQQIHKQPPPPAFLLGIPGYHFELGIPISDLAEKNLQAATVFFQTLLDKPDQATWSTLSLSK